MSEEGLGREIGHWVLFGALRTFNIEAKQLRESIRQQQRKIDVKPIPPV
jgi:hypothetical protein